MAVALGIPLASAAGAPASAAPAESSSPAGTAATSPSSPVNLATTVNFADGVASRGATVSAGDARFEVLGDGLIRMEYSPAGSFEDVPTVNVVDRRFPVPAYGTSVHGGWLTIATRQATLRYRLGSGPFGPANLSVGYRNGAVAEAASPAW